ncbi:glycosyltransferase [Clostridium felsineum]|uniref:Undecaprenyl-phosphate 4-deoxy-4-formamido-L-arabinose transferase n=1 Tax=Clostridium felsineum TaxID=36839 RepID=A0A1S8L0A3_9CLOT|nr:glycosyltransferase [Clostridium felsineum]URZ06307.1 Undecaprenyl-phosphate 4-deoxy-4-formamido-L-arabinose transferase [Clostridium felsineum]URZ11342.1 Undecaprenyl-phosphate 4-deoxy-4-formamido-L-arabinose transferase [Clostridium felsineum]
MGLIPKVSILMPTYNSEDYLEESIESILNQTYRDFEFIIINDGSNDNSLDIINNYADKDDRIVVVSRKNKGLVYSLNEGIALSKGEYIARMDSDDISIYNRIEKQVDILDNNKNVDILGTTVQVIGNITEQQKNIYNNAFSINFDASNIRDVFLTSCAIPHPSVMLRKEVIIKIGGYSEKYATAEDYDLWLRALRKGYNISKMDEVLLKYRIHTKSKSANEISNFKMAKYTIMAKLDYIKDMRKENKVNYLIWGASKGGNVVKEVIDNNAENFNLVGFVDKFKTGDLCGYKIYKPEEIAKIKADYIFIATAPGKKEANDFLINIGLKKVKDYIDFVV